MFRKNMRYLRRKAGMSQNELAAMLGYKSFTTVQKWEDGTSVPPYNKLLFLASTFGVSVEDLMGKDLTETRHAIPVLGTVRAGQPIFAEEMISDYEPITYENVEEYFCLDVVGDSMINARICEGDRLYVHRQAVVANNDIAVVLIGNEATVKRVIYDGDRVILKPENDAYEPIILQEKDQLEKGVSILGKVVYNKIRL